MSLSSLAMMYIFRWGMIHSAVASIYNCLWPTWVEQTDVSLQAGHESDSLLNQDTVFLISFTNHFTSNDSYLQSLRPLPRCLPPPPRTPPSPHLPHSCLPGPLFLLLLLFFLLSAAQRRLWKEKMAASHRRAKQLPALLEFLLNFLSMTTPGWQPTHPQTFFQFSPFLAVWRSYVQCCYHHILHIHFITDMQAFQPQDVFFFNCIYLLYLYTNVILTMTHITKIGSRFDHNAFDMFNQSDHLQTAKLFHKTICSVQLKMHILAAANWHHQSFGATGCRGHNRHIHTCPHVHAHSCNKAGKDTVSLELSSVNHLLVCMDSCSVNWSAPCMDMFKRGCRDIDVSYEANGGKKWFLSFSNG